MADTPLDSGATFLLRPSDPADTVIPDDLGEEERMLVQAMHDYAEQEVAPVMDRVTAGDPEVKRALFRKAAELGVFMAEVPEEMGGLDLNVLAITGMCSSGGDLGGLHSLIFGHQGIGMLPIVNFGTPEQIERYLVPCMEGEMISAFALTEPATGSDAMNIQTRAVLDEDGTHYVVNGAKQWITNAGLADIFILFAKVDGEHFTAFILERDTPGVEVGEPERLLGQHGSNVAAVTLEDVRIPVDNVLGEVGRGHKVALCTLNMGRLKLSAGNATGAKKALKEAARYAAERRQFGRPIADFGLIRRKLADMATRAYAADAMSYRTAGLVYRALEAGGTDDEAAAERSGGSDLESKLAALAEFSVECALAKVFTSEAYNDAADEALQIFGGYGFSEEYAPARMYRDSRIARIYEGTNEICRLYAQRTIFRRWAAGTLPLDAASPAGAPEGAGQSDARAAVAGAGQEGATVAPAFDAIPGELESLKAAYRRLSVDTAAHLGPEALNAPEHQQFLGSLADMALEIFAAESAYLRSAKLMNRPDDGNHDVRRDLAVLALDRAVRRVRDEAATVAAEVAGKAGAAEALETMLPRPRALISVRNRVAERVVAWGGEIPEVPPV